MLVAPFVAARAQAQSVADFRAGANGQITFVTPTRKVECTFTPKGGTPVYKPFDGGPELSCDQSEPKYVRVVLTPKSVRKLADVGDQDCCGVDNPLKYGARWTKGPFICDSAETGLTCKRPDGHGFLISHAGIRTF